MEKEISEQLSILPNILSKYIDSTTGDIKFDLPDDINKIIIVASGSSYHCARFAVELIEKISKIETRAIYSSEFLSKNVIPQDKNSLYIFISQSGETTDTYLALKRVKELSTIPTLCITNNNESIIWKESDYKILCHAGKEYGIAATKSFTSQMLCLILISLKLVENDENRELITKYKNSLNNIEQIVYKTLGERARIKKRANNLVKQDVIVIAADGISYSLAKEGALKIKETSYKNISAAILGEFMHGHVAVLNNKKSVLIYIAVDKISQLSSNNLTKIKADYNPQLVLIGPIDENLNSSFNINIKCENVIQQLFANVIVLQLIALEMALKLKRNVDNPKGLHKVVK